MANLGSIAAVITDIDEKVTTNGNGQNTGARVNASLNNIIDTLVGSPVTGGNVAGVSVFASAAQGQLAATALQPGGVDNVSELINDAGYLTSAPSTLTGNLAYVDAVIGNDATGTVGDLTLPYATLLAAQTAAPAGTTIVVRPGEYASTPLGKNGVNWYFMPGANVTFAGNGFTASTTMTYVVGGYGFFSGTGRLASISGGGCNIYIECQGANTSNGFGITQINSKLIISVRNNWTIGNGITSEVTAANALAEVKANSITVSAGGAVPFTITNGGMDIEAKVFTYTGAATSMFLFNGGTLQLIRSRITAESLTGPVISKTAVGGILRLTNTVIFGPNSENSIDGTETITVFSEGSQVGTPLGSTVVARGSLYRAIVAVPSAGDVPTIGADGTWDWA